MFARGQGDGGGRPQLAYQPKGILLLPVGAAIFGVNRGRIAPILYRKGLIIDSLRSIFILCFMSSEYKILQSASNAEATIIASNI